MRDLLLSIVRSPIQIGLGATALGVLLLIIALCVSSVRWLRYVGVSLTAASIVALLPALIAHGWASSAANPGGGDFSGFGFLLVPVIFFVVWLPALPVAFLLAVTSPAVQRLGHREPNNKSRTATG